MLCQRLNAILGRGNYSSWLAASVIRMSFETIPTIPSIFLFSLTLSPRHSVECFRPGFCQNLGEAQCNFRNQTIQVAKWNRTCWSSIGGFAARKLLKITRPTFSVRHFLRLKVAATNSVNEKSWERGPMIKNFERAWQCHQKTNIGLATPSKVKCLERYEKTGHLESVGSAPNILQGPVRNLESDSSKIQSELTNAQPDFTKGPPQCSGFSSYIGADVSSAICICSAF